MCCVHIGFLLLSACSSNSFFFLCQPSFFYYFWSLVFTLSDSIQAFYLAASMRSGAVWLVKAEEIGAGQKM